MFYLADVGIFLLLIGFFVVCCCWAGEQKLGTSLLEGDVIRLAAVLGGWALWQMLWGYFDARVSPAFLVFLVAAAVICTKKFNYRALITSRLRALSRGVRSLPLTDLFLLLYVVAICVLTFVLCLVPPSSGDYDSLVYHLAAPHRYVDAGRIIELPYDHHSYFPFTVEMWFMWGLAVKGPVLAKLFHWLMLPLSCAAIWAFGRRNVGVRAASWAAALWASLPVVQSEATTAYIDLGFALWVILAFGCAANWRETNENRWLYWAGAFGGFALGTKYLGALTVFFIGAWALGYMVRTRGVQLKPLLVYASLALLLGGGWYVRNTIWTGNPVYPFAYGLFGGKGWTAQMAADYTHDQQAYGFGRGPLDLLLVPWRLSMSPLNDMTVITNPTNNQQQLVLAPQPWWPISNTTVTNGTTGLFESAGLALQILIGPVLLAFGLPTLFMRRKPAALGLWLWACVFFALFWFPTGQYLRYLLPAFALLCLPCGWTISRLAERTALLRWVANGCLVLWFAFVPLLTLQQNARSWGVIAGHVTPEAYLKRTFGGYRAMQWLNTHVGQSTVAVYGEPRCFYLRAPYFWADDPHNNLVDYAQVGKSGTALVKELRRLNAAYVLWNKAAQSNGGFGGPPPDAMNDAIARGLLQKSFEANGYQVFSIEKEAA